MWNPSYRTGLTNYQVESDECPKSCITAQSKDLISIVSQAEAVRAASGTHPLGHSSRWDARFADAVVILAQERASMRRLIRSQK